MPHHFYHHRPGFRYRRRFYRRHWPYRWSWLHSPDSPEGPVPSPFVAWAQRVLAQVFGPIVPQDGVLGPETRRFVGQFQAQNGLPMTGDLDGATVSALQAPTLGPELVNPIPRRPEPAMPHGRHRDRGDQHAGRREPPMPQAGGQEPVIQKAGRSAPQPPPTSKGDGHGQDAAPQPEAGELNEFGFSFAEASKPGKWVRDGGRIILMGA